MLKFAPLRAGRTERANVRRCRVWPQRDEGSRAFLRKALQTQDGMREAADAQSLGKANRAHFLLASMSNHFSEFVECSLDPVNEDNMLATSDYRGCDSVSSGPRGARRSGCRRTGGTHSAAAKNHARARRPQAQRRLRAQT